MSMLDKLTDKKYIKKLNNKRGAAAASAIREFLLDNVFQTGGHLASNLGMVELTLALHKAFDFPNDKIIFDVGHQSYVHKILSGRADRFSTLRKLNGLSGFPKTAESPYDSFNTGHSSTSVSAALGIARARDLKGEDFNVIALIGDGALGGGMAFEALNDIGDGNTKIIIVLNDNEMSINKNVGGLSAHLSMLRLEKKYINAKSKMHNLLDKTGKIGEHITKFVKRAKEAIKFAAIAAPMFEDLGLTYIGIIDGHNIEELSEAFEKAKNIDGPVIIHICTIKGKGYQKAEKNPALYHGISAKSAARSVDEMCYNQVFGSYICKKAEEKPNLVAITAAMTAGCGLTEFSKKFPQRFFDVGIAEQHAVTFAAGLATQNILPVFSVYSTFLQRGYDQLIHDVCLQNLHVVFAIDRAGIVGPDGETHQGIFDLSYLLHIPNMTVLAPSCVEEFTEMLDYAIDVCNGPVAVRYPKAIALNRETKPFELAKCEVTRTEGDTVLILTVGRMLECGERTANLLADKNIGASVVNLRSIKPFDYDVISELSKKAKLIVTIEDNIINGGAGCFIKTQMPPTLSAKMITIGYDDCYIPQGTQDELFDLYGLNPVSVTARIEKELLNK